MTDIIDTMRMTEWLEHEKPTKKDPPTVPTRRRGEEELGKRGGPTIGAQHNLCSQPLTARYSIYFQQKKRRIRKVDRE